MELLFIGTGSGKTVSNRFHSSLLFHNSSRKILIDTGDGISRALLNQGISYNAISDIIFSHYHSDHLAGLPSLLTQMEIQNRVEPLLIFTHSNLVNHLKYFLNISYLFLEKLKFPVQIVGYDFDKEIKITDYFNFLARQNSHITNKHNISNSQLHFISSSFLFLVENQKIVYTSDIGHTNDLYLFQDIDADIFISETTHVPSSKIEDAAIILAPKKTYLTHIEDEIRLNQWFDQLSNDKKKQFILVHDGMKISIH